MKIRLCLLFVLASVCSVFSENHSWDLAVSLNSQIELLNQTGALQGYTTDQMYRGIESVTYDEVRHQFVVSQSRKQDSNSSIYSIKLTNDAIPSPILRNVPDKIKGIAIDPITDVLYWTDHNKNRILKMSLNESISKVDTLIQFKDARPTGLAIDSCRRKLYWTNRNSRNPTIESSNLDGSSHEILISSNLDSPQGISIDHYTKRIYWTDQKKGIYYSVESANFDGTDRKTVILDTRQEPEGIAITENMIFWTDISNNVLWGLKKNASNGTPVNIRSFYEQPRGIYAKNDLTQISECTELINEINKNKNRIEKFINAQDSAKCIFGSLVDDKCQCELGYAGKHCEYNLCLNYCFSGQCSISVNGYPQCSCEEKFTGERCEIEVCKNYCLNDGLCKVTNVNNTKSAKCECQQGFGGDRCEKNLADNICTVLCEEGEEYKVLDSDGKKCRCANSVDTYSVVTKANVTSELLLSTNFSSDLSDKLKDPSFVVSWMLTMIMFWIVVVMCFMLYRQRYMRPRIKKRIIVNKNITPLTYRPGQSSEQCEITIENCCNMNICETPCFEPPKFQCKKSDEKKTLLTNMENGGDIY